MADWADSPVSEQRPGSWAFQLALCLLGPVFFLSYLFSLLSPLPGLYLHSGTANRRHGLFWYLFSLIIGCALVGTIKGWQGGVAYFLLAALPSFVLGEVLLRKKRVEIAVMSATFAILLLSLSGGWLYAKKQNLSPLQMAQSMVELRAKSLVDHLLSQKEELSEQMQAELLEIQKNPNLLLEEIPGLAIAGILLLVTLPCIALIRWNPKGFLRRAGIPRDFLRRWAAPDWLVWPALICGALLLYEVDYLSLFAKNALKPIILIYFFHGMSILAFFLDSLRMRGPMRILVYSMGIMFAIPMVVSFGFFDLWFNFRRRVRRQQEDKDDEP